MPRIGQFSARALTGLVRRVVTVAEVTPTIISSYIAGTSASSVQTRAGISQSIFFSGSQSAVLPAVTRASFATYPVTVEAFVWNDTGGYALQLRNPTLNQSTVVGNGWAQTDRTGNVTVSDNFSISGAAWTHIAFSLYSSTASTTVADRLIVFVNGTTAFGMPVSLPSGSENYQATGETALQLGAFQYNAGGAVIGTFSGFISDVRVSSGTRYGTTAGSYTVPSGAMAIDGTTLALIRAV